MRRSTLIRSLAALSGSAVLAFGLCHIHANADITEGGFLGLSLLLYHHFAISPAVSTLLLNAAAYLLGIRVLGREFLYYSALSVGGFSLFYALFDLLPPFLAAPSAMPLFAATVGALFVGVGCGLAVWAGGAPSGDDAVGMVLSRRLSLDIRLFYLVSDLLVLGLSLTYIPLGKILWSLLTVVLSGQIIGFIQKLPKIEAEKPSKK
ncbi:MAG: YitT family protein [Clostridia bacterium]|nr:YitT family protein [Clostridia bacterium]